MPKHIFPAHPIDLFGPRGYYVGRHSRASLVSLIGDAFLAYSRVQLVVRILGLLFRFMQRYRLITIEH